jgi:putative transposase
VPLHLIQRGNNRSACFFAEADYARYLGELGELSRKYGCRVHAYVLMTNHVHILLTPEEVDSASLTMKHLGQRYVQYVNRTYRRSGTLWEGRFKSCLSQDESYVLACYRYIELNPVRAGMCVHPREYHWSSYRANAGEAHDAIVTAHGEFRRLGATREARRAAYRRLLDERLDPAVVEAIRASTRGNYALGNQSFQAEIESALRRRARPGSAGRPRLELAGSVTAISPQQRGKSWSVP